MSRGSEAGRGDLERSPELPDVVDRPDPALRADHQLLGTAREPRDPDYLITDIQTLLVLLSHQYSSLLPQIQPIFPRHDNFRS